MFRSLFPLADLLLILSQGAGFACALPTAANEGATTDSCTNVIDGVGTFTNSAVYTFNGSTLPEGLHAPDGELIKDRDHPSPAPYNHVFQASNVAIKDGFLQIKVPGGQTPATAPNFAITGGQVFTEDAGILYASVRTHAILDTEPGTCSSTFFYKTNTQEIDIEFLSDPNSTANTAGKASLHYTNQANPSITSAHLPPSDIGSAVHEYRIDWTKDFTAFYVDGVLQQKYTQNVPTMPGTWLWENWSNGDIRWSAGPPAKDNVMKVQRIEMYYNTTSGTAKCT